MIISVENWQELCTFVPKCAKKNLSYSLVVKHWVISSKHVENVGCFLHILAQMCIILVNFPQEIIIVYQQNWQKHCIFGYFSIFFQIEAIQYPSFYLIGLLWNGDLRETPKLQNSASFGFSLSSPKTLVVLYLPCNVAHCTVYWIASIWTKNGKISKNTMFLSVLLINYDNFCGKLTRIVHICAKMCKKNLSYSLVVKHWVISSKHVENVGCFLHILAQMCTILVNFPQEIIIVYQQNWQKHCIFGYFPFFFK